MAKKIIIVESPAKAKTIKEILGGEYEVISSRGHVRDLPEKEFGVNIENFEPTFQIIDGKEKVVEEIIEKTKNKEVYLASDMDREGEAIAWHLANILNILNKKNRIVFSEITPQTIRSAVKSPRFIDMKKVHAQLARRILDRIVGYKVSPLLWKLLRTSSSAGRVQSAALKLVCEREVQRHRFVPKRFWKVQGYIGSLRFYLTHVDGKKIEMQQVDETLAQQIKREVKELKLVQKKVRTVEKKPPLPFITSTLQQEAANRFGFSVAKTMQLAQMLYEGVETPEGHRAFITYMRTDSTRISEYARDQAEKFIKKNFGERYLGEFRTEQKKPNVQDAHEAIRPVDVELTPEKAQKLLDRDLLKLYRLIWERFVASQMAPAVYEETIYIFESDRYGFEAKMERRIFEGFEAVMNKQEEHVKPLEGEIFSVTKWNIEQDETKPPARYTEPSMVRALEAKGIGRPSTYATIISTLLERKYVVKKSKELVPTVLGFVVNHYMEQRFPKIVDLDFTARMEEALDAIERGEKDYKQVLNEFYEEFSEQFTRAEREWLSIDIQTNVDCECGQKFSLKVGRFGLYLSCPSCGKTSSIELESPAVMDGNVMYFTDQEESRSYTCPNCGGELKRTSGKYGAYYHCPKCGKNYKDFARGSCPRCGSAVEKKVSKNKKSFFKCTNPDCDYVSWLEPSQESCPDCGERLHYRKIRSSERLYCQKCRKMFQKPGEGTES
ncbi:DNA topoisomerase I [Thermotoga sp. Ku-13t]|uniref:type I DNA topoisomerase n=1 Tax=Thermotoga sp. Ku-13t TaxID=1755813 RepID=UPI0013EA0685|nr:type I DNA topoisomerase [Thermotoga sp. Ku-13t]KAF2957727.1 DNA topoisomerase I [Thermotoga sp. Ku-13t]